MLGGGNDRLFGVLCQKLGKPEWASNPKFFTNSARVKNRIELEALIEAETSSRTTKEWLEILDGSGLPYSAINDIQGTLNHEHGECLYIKILHPYSALMSFKQYSPATWLRKLNTRFVDQ